MTVDRVVIGGDGRVVLHPGPARGDAAVPPARRPSGVALGSLLEDIARTARSRTPAGQATDSLLAELDRAVAQLPVAGVRPVARTLDEVAAAGDRPAVRAELGALARAIGPHAERAPGAGWAGGTATAGFRPGPAPRPAAQENRNARRRIGAWLLSILALAGVVLLENALLRDKVAADIGVLLDAGRSGSTPSAVPKPDGLPLVPPAPAAAGSVRGVDLRTLTTCTPGAPCTVRLLIRVAPSAGPQAVTPQAVTPQAVTPQAVTPADREVVLPHRRPVYRLRRLRAGRLPPIPAGGERVAVVATVPLPPVPALGVVAVTEVPAVAASAPVLVGSCGPGTG